MNHIKRVYLVLILVVVSGFFYPLVGRWFVETPFYKGVALGAFDLTHPLSSYKTELKEIRAQGANSISLPVYWFQEDIHATDLHPFRGDQFDQSAYDDRIRGLIRVTHDMGLSVLLMPIVQLEKKEHGQWRGAVEPVSWSAWFASYRRFILHYAKLAAETGVETYCIGSELSSAEGYKHEWQPLIQQVRAVFKGSLTYSANWDHYRQVSFWDEVDFLGISGYYRLTTEMPTNYPRLQQTWLAIRGELVAWQKDLDKPLLFTEIGYPSQANAARTPWDYTAKGYPDGRLQQLCYRAFIEAWKGVPELAGVYLWIWEPMTGGPTDRGYTWRNKPAQQEITAWFSTL